MAHLRHGQRETLRRVANKRLTEMVGAIALPIDHDGWFGSTTFAEPGRPVARGAVHEAAA